MDDRTVTWDQVVESTLLKANTQDDASSKRAKLRLTMNPEVRHLVKFNRSIAAIDKTTRAAIRSLVSGEADWPLFMHGPAGTGKTCAALCLLDHTEFGGMYWQLSKLCQHVIEVQQGRVCNSAGYKTSVEKFWIYVEGAGLVVIDEIGCRDRVSDHVYETLKSVLDCRHRKPLVCISNLALEKIEELFDDRIASRLCEGTELHLGGMDRRLKA